jgi:hypothetical protein
MTSLPRIRSGLLRHPLDGQVLVYDAQADRVHLLDPTTALVLELLQEGGWTRDGIVIEMSERLGVPRDLGLLSLAIDQLRESDLFDKTSPAPDAIPDVGRRELLQKLAMTGAAALLVPAIATLTATKGYAQGTIGGVGFACTTNVQCISQRCCGGLCRTAACTANGNDCSPNGLNCNCCSGNCQGSGKCTT